MVIYFRSYRLNFFSTIPTYPYICLAIFEGLNIAPRLFSRYLYLYNSDLSLPTRVSRGFDILLVVFHQARRPCRTNTGWQNRTTTTSVSERQATITSTLLIEGTGTFYRSPNYNPCLISFSHFLYIL